MSVSGMETFEMSFTDRDRKRTLMDEAGKRATLPQFFIWEAFGTGLLVCGALMNSSGFGVAVSMSLAFMLCFQQTGSQLNPIVSMNFMLRGDISVKECVVCSCAQVVGAFGGAMLVYFTNVAHYVVAPVIFDGLQNYQAFTQEVIGSFFLVTMLNIQQDKISRVTDDAFMLGIYFTCIIFTARQFASGSGGVLNPAAAIGINCAALITNTSAELVGWFWIYMIAPVCGGLVSWAFFHYAFIPTLLTMRQYNADKKNE